MKRLLTSMLCFIIVLLLTGCLHGGNYKVVASLNEGSGIKIEYNGIIYNQTGNYSGDFPGDVVFHLDYGQICSTVAYDAYIDGNQMYLKAKQPFWADIAAVSFVLTADGESADKS